MCFHVLISMLLSADLRGRLNNAFVGRQDCIVYSIFQVRIHRQTWTGVLLALGWALPLEFSFLNLKGLPVFILLCSSTVHKQKERQELENRQQYSLVYKIGRKLSLMIRKMKISTEKRIRTLILWDMTVVKFREQSPFLHLPPRQW